MPMPTQWPARFLENFRKNGNKCKKNQLSGTGCVRISRMAREFHALNALAPVKI
jgi:hypothetical protein